MKTYLSGLLLILCFRAIGQQNDTMFKHENVKPLTYDTNYIAGCGDVIAVEPWIATPSFSFRLEPPEDSVEYKHSAYQPYLRGVFGIDFNYRALNVSLGIRGPVAEAGEKIYGQTQYRILKMRLNTSPYIFEFYHNDFKGFSDRNTPAYDTLRPNDDVFVKRRDLRLQYTKLKAIYIFSHKKFSYGAAYSFTEKQRKTKGTFLAVTHAYHMRANADSTFINPGQRGYFGKYDNMNYLDVLSMGAGPGYAGTLVYKKWFFSIGLYFMVDAQYHHARNNSGQHLSDGWRAAALGDVFLSFGYNGDRFYSGFVLRGDRNMVALPFVNASTTYYSSVFSIGFRFLPPLVVPKLYDISPLRYL